MFYEHFKSEPPTLISEGGGGWGDKNFEGKLCLKIWRVNLMETCHVLPILLSLMDFLRYHIYYLHLKEVNLHIMYFVLYSVKASYKSTK